MIASRRSSATAPNTALEKQTRQGRSIAKLMTDANLQPDGTLLLVGGTDLIHFRLRVAQSHLRQDLTPSSWSHVGILREGPGGLSVSEVALDPPSGFADMPRSNGIQTAPLTRYDDARRFPNVALLRFPLGDGQIAEGIARVRDERGLLDLGALILPWLAFVWGVGLPANPLLSSTGIPSAVFTEAVFGALRQELTPGLATRSSCPEAIWQSARYWYPYYTLAAADPETRTATSTTRGRTPHGVFVVEQDYAAILPAEEPRATTPAPAAKPTRAATPPRGRRT
jgi:hypothetical protein